MEAKRDTARLPLRERNRQRIIQRIMDASFALFSTAGYEQTTMDAIAEKAEVSRGTLFNYFPAKTALLIPFAGELYKQYIQPEIFEYLDTQPATIDALKFLFLKIGEQVLTLPDMELALQQECFPSNEGMQTLVQKVGFFDTLLVIVRQGQQRGEVRTDISPEKLAHYVGLLYISPVRLGSAKHPSTDYSTEIETLLAFLRTALLQ